MKKIFFSAIILLFPVGLYSQDIYTRLFHFDIQTLGRIDTLLGLREEELRNSSISNPIMREILKNMEAIKEELKEIRSKTIDS
jgi:hypothetical protein